MEESVPISNAIPNEPATPESAPQAPKTPPPSPIPSRSLTTDTELGKRLKLMSDYASALKDKSILEESMAILKYTNADLLDRLKLTQKELEQTKLKLRENDAEIERLKQQKDAADMSLEKEKKMFSNYAEERDAIVDELRATVGILRRKLCLVTADVDRSRRTLGRCKRRCADYKEKLRGFAILFTYFNDPSRRTSESSLLSADVTFSEEMIPSKMNSLGVMERADRGVKRDFRMY